MNTWKEYLIEGKKYNGVMYRVTVKTKSGEKTFDIKAYNQQEAGDKILAKNSLMRNQLLGIEQLEKNPAYPANTKFKIKDGYVKDAM